MVKSARPVSKETFSRWDAADHLKTRAQIAAYLDACMEEGGDDPAFIAAALGDIARARRFSAIGVRQARNRDRTCRCPR
jgi:probable addiction module antidote protein